MKRYIKNGVVINFGTPIDLGDGHKLYFAKEADYIDNGYAIYEESLQEPTLEVIKADKINAIDEYSNSDNVNCFIYNGKKMWIDRQDRIILIGETIPVAEMLGKTDITLSLGEVVVTMHIDYVKQVLNAITAYAVNCYDITNAKKAEVNACTSIDEVNNIDVKDGYPTIITL